jgi:hypothetical protein
MVDHAEAAHLDGHVWTSREGPHAIAPGPPPGNRRAVYEHPSVIEDHRGLRMRTRKFGSLWHLSRIELQIEREAVLLEQLKAGTPDRLAHEVPADVIVQRVGVNVQDLANPAHVRQGGMLCEDLVHIGPRQICVATMPCGMPRLPGVAATD